MTATGAFRAHFGVTRRGPFSASAMTLSKRKGCTSWETLRPPPPAPLTVRGFGGVPGRGVWVRTYNSVRGPGSSMTVGRAQGRLEGCVGHPVDPPSLLDIPAYRPLVPVSWFLSSSSKLSPDCRGTRGVGTAGSEVRCDP